MLPVNMCFEHNFVSFYINSSGFTCPMMMTIECWRSPVLLVLFDLLNTKADGNAHGSARALIIFDS